MRKFLTTSVLVAFAVCVVAAQAKDPQVGTWKLNAAKSKFADASMAPKTAVTTIEAAAYLRMSRQFLECARYRGDGSGPPYLKVGKSVRYRRSALDVWMSAHDHPADKPGRVR